MQSGIAVIIHGSPIVQQGLKNLLLSRNIAISTLTDMVPECALLSSWKDTLLLVDLEFAGELKKHFRILKKNGNTVIGISNSDAIHSVTSDFDEIIAIHDNAETIFQKTGGYQAKHTNNKSGSQLSSRENEILSMVAQGFSNKMIADKLFLSIHTVITHRKNITYKLGIKSISGLTLYAALNNLVDSQP